MSPENAPKIGLETKSFSTDFIQSKVEALLSSVEALKKVNDLTIEGKGNRITLTLDFEAKKSGVAVKGVVTAVIGNFGNTINVIEEPNVKAGFTDRLAIKVFLTPKLKGISEELKFFIEREENRKVEKMEIVNGELVVTFKAQEEKTRETSKVEGKKDFFTQDEIEKLLSEVEETPPRTPSPARESEKSAEDITPTPIKKTGEHMAPDGTKDLYGEDGVLLSRTYPDGRETFYFPNGKEKGIKNANGTTWYREGGSVRTKFLTDGTVEDYDETGRLIKKELKNGSVERYDPETGELRERFDPNGRVLPLVAPEGLPPKPVNPKKETVRISLPPKPTAAPTETSPVIPKSPEEETTESPEVKGKEKSGREILSKNDVRIEILGILNDGNQVKSIKNLEVKETARGGKLILEALITADKSWELYAILANRGDGTIIIEEEYSLVPTAEGASPEFFAGVIPILGRKIKESIEKSRRKKIRGMEIENNKLVVTFEIPDEKKIKLEEKAPETAEVKGGNQKSETVEKLRRVIADAQRILEENRLKEEILRRELAEITGEEEGALPPVESENEYELTSLELTSLRRTLKETELELEETFKIRFLKRRKLENLVTHLKARTTMVEQKLEKEKKVNL